MKPLFSVGEEVVLCSESFPEENGEYVIVDLIDPQGRGVDFVTGNAVVGFGYKLSNTCYKGWWRESSLRKKHKPSDFDFDELMSEIKDLVTV